MKTTGPSHIALALAALEAERDNLTARIAKVEQGIATLRDLFHLPASTGPRAKREPAASPTNGNGHSSTSHGKVSADAIRAALQHGPLSPGALAQQLGISALRLRQHLARLEQDGVIVSTGKTAGRRLALAGTPAKEAP